MQCPSCEYQNENGALFCSRCGGKLTTLVETEEPREMDDDRFVDLVRDKLAGQYRVLSVLGRGGMAYVFEAIELELDRKVALKVLPMEHTYAEDLVRRFKREAKLAAGLHHPHIIPIYRVGSEGRVHYFTMAYMEGGTLDEWVREGMHIGDAVEIVKQVADALAYAHSKKLIHRDIKPANIMFDIHGSAYVADFGIAKAAAHTITATRSFFGTPHYMSPEQVVDDRIDGRADLYALGVLFYQMTTGQYPFDGKEALSVMYKHVNLEPEAPTVIHSKVPIEVSRIILKLLAKDPEKRYQTGDALLQDLEALKIESVSTKRKPAGTSKLPPKNPDIAQTIKMDGANLPPPRRTTVPVKFGGTFKKNKKTLLAAGFAGLAFVVLMIFLLSTDFQSSSETETDLSGSDSRTADSVPAQPESDPDLSALNGFSEETGEQSSLGLPGEDELGILPVTGVTDISPNPDQVAENPGNTETEPVIDEADEESTPPEKTGNGQEKVIVETDPSPSPEKSAEERNQTIVPEKTTAGTTVNPSEIKPKKSEPKPSSTPPAKKTIAKTKTPDHPAETLVDTGLIERISRLVTAMGLIEVPGGAFEMGNNSLLNREERPVHRVMISPFKIGRTEVTQDLWIAVMAENPSCHKGGDQPVENVSWDDVQGFLQKLNRILGTTYRLPTEAEWEYVCGRGKYGEDIGTVAWVAGNSGNLPRAAGSKKPDAGGLYDLKGNVWEWCADWYDRRYYRDAPDRDPRGPDRGTDRVIRGGGWDAKAAQCRCYKRASMPPAERKCSVGFRIVDPLPDKPPESAPR